MPKAIDRLLTFDEAAELLGTSPNIPRRLVAERKSAVSHVLARFAGVSVVQPGGAGRP